VANRRYWTELRERAVKMVFKVRKESGQEKGAIAKVAARPPRAGRLRCWVTRRQDARTGQIGPGRRTGTALK